MRRKTRGRTRRSRTWYETLSTTYAQNALCQDWRERYNYVEKRLGEELEEAGRKRAEMDVRNSSCSFTFLIFSQRMICAILNN